MKSHISKQNPNIQAEVKQLNREENTMIFNHAEVTRLLNELEASMLRIKAIREKFDLQNKQPLKQAA